MRCGVSKGPEIFFIVKQKTQKRYLEVSTTPLTHCREQSRFLVQFSILKQRPQKWYLEVSRTPPTRCREQKRFLEQFFIVK